MTPKIKSLASSGLAVLVLLVMMAVGSILGGASWANEPPRQPPCSAMVQGCQTLHGPIVQGPIVLQIPVPAGSHGPIRHNPTFYCPPTDGLIHHGFCILVRGHGPIRHNRLPGWTRDGYGSASHLPAFSTDDRPWRLEYSFQCSGSGLFVVSDNETYWSQVLVNDAGTSGSGTVSEAKSGRHLLTVFSPGCSWTLEAA